MRKVIERALRQAGLELSEVLEASNGEEGLQLPFVTIKVVPPLWR